MFQGSKHVPPDTHFKFLESAGASDINGTTDFDRTNYFETLPSNQLELALWLESDRMGYLLDKLDAPQLANQQDVVRNERRQSVENRPYGIADEAVAQTLFPPDHPYYANVIGSHEDIQAAKLDDVKRFFKLYYAPNNASLAIVGDFDKAQAKALVAKYFGTLKRGAPVPPITAVTPKITQERRKVVTDRVELPRIYLTWITSPIYKPGDADADIAATILGGGKSSRSVQAAGLRQADRAERQRAAVLADPRLDVSDRRHGASGSHRRRAREGGRRGAGQVPRLAARRRRGRARAEHHRDAHRRAAWKRWAASAASPIA